LRLAVHRLRDSRWPKNRMGACSVWLRPFLPCGVYCGRGFIGVLGTYQLGFIGCRLVVGLLLAAGEVSSDRILVVVLVGRVGVCFPITISYVVEWSRVTTRVHGGFSAWKTKCECMLQCSCLVVRHGPPR
jgi:hypothetical protein